MINKMAVKSYRNTLQKRAHVSMETYAHVKVNC